jgi:hypothetical protein
MRLLRLESRWKTVLLCVIVLLVTSSVQANHTCGPGDATTQITGDTGSSPGAGTICLACLVAHSITAVLIFFVFTPAQPAAAQVWLARADVPRYARSLRLYVRPPPQS